MPRVRSASPPQCGDFVDGFLPVSDHEETVGIGRDGLARVILRIGAEVEVVV
jgi:transposase-like protein